MGEYNPTVSTCDVIMDCKIFIDENPMNIDLAAALAEISEQRRKKVLAFRHEQGRKLSAAAYLLLRKALREVYGIDEKPEFEYSEHGKPSITGHPDIYFNLSHCRSAAACVVSSSPVGVDVEDIRDFRDALARHVLSADEYASVVSAPQPAREFIRLWTMKESYLKLTGEGITRDLKTILDSASDKHFDTRELSKSILTVCYS